MLKNKKRDMGYSMKIPFINRRNEITFLCNWIYENLFIEKIYNDSKLRKTSGFMEVDYLSREDVYYCLNRLAMESGIKKYELTKNQIDIILKI